MSLKESRMKAGLTQSELAQKAGINCRVLQHYECGSRDINGAKLITLLKICNALDCELSNIVTDENLLKLMKKVKL